MDVLVKDNIALLTREINKIQKKQIPFATHRALNDTAFDALKELKKQTLKKLDRPTPFTQKGFRVEKSPDKNHLVAEVYIEEKRDKYLKFQVKGGTRNPKGRAILVPTKHSSLNKFGNIGRNTAQRLYSDKRHFVGMPKGSNDQSAGIFKRVGAKKRQKIKMILAFESRVNYRRGRFPFEKIVKGIVSSKFNKNFEKHFTKALATAK